jgi:hypothetical protein
LSLLAISLKHPGYGKENEQTRFEQTTLQLSYFIKKIVNNTLRRRGLMVRQRKENCFPVLGIANHFPEGSFFMN